MLVIRWKQKMMDILNRISLQKDWLLNQFKYEICRKCWYGLNYYTNKMEIYSAYSKY